LQKELLMLLIEYENGEIKGFEFTPIQEKVIEWMLNKMKPDFPYKITPSQAEAIKNVWEIVHNEYIQTQYYFVFNDNFTFIKKKNYEYTNVNQGDKEQEKKR